MGSNASQQSPHPPLTPGPHGEARAHVCGGCGRIRAAYPPHLPAGWEEDESGTWCDRCTRVPKRRSNRKP